MKSENIRTITNGVRSLFTAPLAEARRRFGRLIMRQPRLMEFTRGALKPFPNVRACQLVGLFSKHGWVSEGINACVMREDNGRPVLVHDGAQVWRNRGVEAGS